MRGKPIFTASNGGPVIISGKTTVDVIPGRLHLKDHSTDLQSVLITDEDNGLDISLQLTGEYRHQPSVQQGTVGSRGVQDHETYTSDYVASTTEWRDSNDPKHHYNLDFKVAGSKKIGLSIGSDKNDNNNSNR